MKSKTLLLSAALGLTSALALGTLPLTQINQAVSVDFSSFEGTYSTLPAGVSFTTGQSERGFFNYNAPPTLTLTGFSGFRENADAPVIGFVHRRGTGSPANQFFNITFSNNTGQTVNDFVLNVDFLQPTQGSRATEIQINWNPSGSFTTNGITNGGSFIASFDEDNTSVSLLDPFVLTSRTIQYTSFSGVAAGESVTFGFNIRNGDGSGNNAHVGFANMSVTAIPEPGSLILVGIMGVAAVVVLRRKRA